MAAKKKAAVKKSARAPKAPAAPPRTLVTQSDFARHMGVTPQTVQEWREKRRLVTVGEGRALRVDLEASERRVKATRDPQQDAVDDPDLTAAKTRKEIANAQLAELKLAEQRGLVVDKATTRRIVFDFIRGHREALLNLTASVAPGMAARLGCDEHDLFVELDRLFRTHAKEQAARVMRLKTKSSLDDPDDESEDSHDADA